MKSLWPGFLIFLLCLITFFIWILGKGNLSLVFSSPYTSFSQILALLGLILASFNFLLSTKQKLIENLFGGLDKVYEVHKTTGALAFVFILTHPLLLVLEVLPKLDLALVYLIPGRDLSYSLGIFSILFFILSFIFIVFINLSYNKWIYTHRLLGVAFFLTGLHILTISSDVSTNLFLRYWILFFWIVGTISFLYIVFFYRFIGPRYLYEVVKIVRKFDILDFYLKPLERKMTFMPGQFVYLSFLNKDLGGELHPFSLSFSPRDELMRVSVKILGDFTLKMKDVVKEGDRVWLYGPYGRFSQKYFTFDYDNFVFIAGGIGVTPFLSIIRDRLSDQGRGKTLLFYSFSSEYEAVFDDEIREIKSKVGELEYIPWNSSLKGRLTAQKVLDFLSSCNLKKTLIMICGPILMMENLKNQFISLGVSEDNIVFEKFAFL
jgi:predicted ferric reductase